MVMIWPCVISCAMPRPATIRISVAMIGWMPMTATRTPFQRPSAIDSPSAAAIATSTPPTLFWFAEVADQQAGERAGDRDDGADGEVDAAGGDHERHAERDQHQRRAEAQDVDQAAVEVPVLHARDEEATWPKKRFDRAGARRSRAAARARRRVAVMRALRPAIVSTRRSTSTRRRWAARRRRSRSRSTATRWLRRSTSSSSAEMNSTDMPSSAERSHEPLDLGLGADVDAARRLVEDQQPRLGDQPAGEQHLLLVAAAERCRPGCSGRRGGCRAP